MKNGAGWPMGPCTLVDLVGIDVHVHASEALYEKLREPRMAPPPRLVAMKNAGLLGRKSGRGFYTLRLRARLTRQVGVDHRHAEARGHGRDERSLDDDREQDDDEHDPVDLRRLVGAADDRERREQDRHRALQARPRDEQPLAA